MLLLLHDEDAVAQVEEGGEAGDRAVLEAGQRLPRQRVELLVEDQDGVFLRWGVRLVARGFVVGV